MFLTSHVEHMMQSRGSVVLALLWGDDLSRSLLRAALTTAASTRAETSWVTLTHHHGIVCPNTIIPSYMGQNASSLWQEPRVHSVQYRLTQSKGSRRGGQTNFPRLAVGTPAIAVSGSSSPSWHPPTGTRFLSSHPLLCFGKRMTGKAIGSRRWGGASIWKQGTKRRLEYNVLFLYPFYLSEMPPLSTKCYKDQMRECNRALTRALTKMFLFLLRKRFKYITSREL